MIVSILMTFSINAQFYPNSFTPNGDIHNQTWLPTFEETHKPYNFHLTIFNRKGRVIWESYDYSVGWDGTYRDELTQDGVYVFKLEFTYNLNDTIQIDYGTITLIR